VQSRTELSPCSCFVCVCVCLCVRINLSATAVSRGSADCADWRSVSRYTHAILRRRYAALSFHILRRVSFFILISLDLHSSACSLPRRFYLSVAVESMLRHSINRKIWSLLASSSPIPPHPPVTRLPELHQEKVVIQQDVLQLQISY
jgi:hypothetical protein